MPGILDRLKKQEQEVDAALHGPRGKTSIDKRMPVLGGGPHIRTGEDPNTSRGFYFSRLFAAMKDHSLAENAKVELELCERMQKSLVGSPRSQYVMDGMSEVMAPFGSNFLPVDALEDEKGNYWHEAKSRLNGATRGVDPQEVAWMRGKFYQGQGKANTPMSWLDESIGGAFVGPPEFGEPIELLRNRAALTNAGARMIPLGPTGRMRWPRLTQATTGGFIGENFLIPSSQLGTGALNLTAKKAAAFVVLPNELIRYGTPAAEAIVREDMAKTVTLVADKNLLEGGGSDVVPLGLINTPGIATVTPSAIGTNGNQMAPQDFYTFAAQIEANNAQITGYIMRPELFWGLVQSRAAVYNGSAAVPLGQFTLAQFREVRDTFEKTINGLRVTTTPQVSQSRVKGASSNLTYCLGGWWEDFLFAVFGAIEFALATQGDSTFQSDQTMIRAILSVDGGPRHPGAFAVADTVNMITNNLTALTITTGTGSNQIIGA